MPHGDCIHTNRRFAAYRLHNVLGPGAARRLALYLLSRFMSWRERARSRHLLLRLDDRMLRDVGLSRSDVDRECAKRFWQP